MMMEEAYDIGETQFGFAAGPVCGTEGVYGVWKKLCGIEKSEISTHNENFVVKGK
jgi:hypothetical protein